MIDLLPSALKILSFGKIRLLKKINGSADGSKTSVVFTTIGLSHFCERSRWALDRSPLKKYYVEYRHLPALHLSSTFMVLAKLPKLSLVWKNKLAFLGDSKVEMRKEKTSVPKLTFPMNKQQHYNRIEDSKKIVSMTPTLSNPFLVLSDGSAGILRYLHEVYGEEDAHMKALYGSGAEAIAVEDMLVKEFAPAVTMWLFGNMLLTGKDFHTHSSDEDDFNNECNMDSIRFFLELCSQDTRVGYLERFIFRFLGQSSIVPLMVKSNHVTAQLREEALEKIEKIFSVMDDIILKRRVVNRSQLDDDNIEDSLFDIASSSTPSSVPSTRLLSAADITFASLCMPLLLPSEGKTFFTTLEDMEAWLRKQGVQADDVSTNSKAVGLQRLVRTRQRLLETHPSARLALHLYKHHRFDVAMHTS